MSTVPRKQNKNEEPHYLVTLPPVFPVPEACHIRIRSSIGWPNTSVARLTGSVVSPWAFLESNSILTLDLIEAMDVFFIFKGVPPPSVNLSEWVAPLSHDFAPDAVGAPTQLSGDSRLAGV